jgi:methylthioribulose-1-phosphate dehydratase
MTPPSAGPAADSNDHLVQSENPDHPANLIPSLCAKFWTLGWVTGTGGGASIREEYAQPSPYPAITTITTTTTTATPRLTMRQRQ